MPEYGLTRSPHRWALAGFLSGTMAGVAAVGWAVHWNAYLNFFLTISAGVLVALVFLAKEEQ